MLAKSTHPRLAGVLLAASIGLYSLGAAAAEHAEMLIYCGITMIRPMTEIARLFEQRENVKITLAQGGSEDLYQSLKKSGQGDLYLPGEPSYHSKYLPEGLFGEHVTVGYNQLALVVRKGNPKNVKGDPKELLRRDLLVLIGSPESGSVGKETKDVLEAAGIYQKVVDVALYLAPDSRVLNNAMKRGEADLLLNWRATATFPDNAPMVDVVDLSPRLAKPQALILTLLNFSKNKALTRRFMAYAAGDEGQAVFRKWGFLDNKAVLK